MSVNYSEARTELKEWLIKNTAGCTLHDGWPCGTCTCHLFAQLGLNHDTPEYSEHNEPLDRINEIWRAIIEIRNAKLNGD